MIINTTECIEICRGDKLIGYAIWFSGGWDVYKLDCRQNLIQVAVNIKNKDEAINLVN